MTENEAQQIIKDALIRINTLMEMEKWKDAHRACLEILRFDPQNIKVIRLKNKIEKIVKKINIKTLKSDLASLEPFWKEKDYPSLVENLKRLEPYANDYPKIRKLYLLAQKKYNEQLIAQQTQLLRQEMEQMQKLAKENRYEEAVKLGEKLITYHFNEEKIKSKLQIIKNNWITYELTKNKGLLESEKYEDILLFYQGLLHINSKNKKIKKLIEKTKKAYQIYKIQQKKDFIYKQLEKIKTLYQLNKFEQVMTLAEELLDIDPQNKDTLYYYKKAKKKAEKLTEKEILKQMKKNREEVNNQRKKEPAEVIKI